MSTPELIFWSLCVACGFIGSALYSGLETGAYSLNRVRLQILDHQGDSAAHTLRKIISQPTVLLSTLLIGNNVVNYLGTASLAIILERHFELGPWQTIIVNTLIVTPMLFVFGETLPKDLFAAHSDLFMYRLTPVLNNSRRLFTWLGLVPLVNAFTWILLKIIGGDKEMSSFHPRRHMHLLVREGVGKGLLTDEQSAIIERVLELGELRVGSEMTPWQRVVKVRLDDPPHVLWDLADKTSHSRFPVVDGKGQVMGILHVIDALMFDKAKCPPVSQLMKPARTLSHETPLRVGLDHLQKDHHAIAIVTDRKNHPVGIVTVKDLVERITGELSSW